MTCPRCQTDSLMERQRDGIEIDVCSSCRGIWLDRGELEKLIERDSRNQSDDRRFGGDDDDDDDRPGRGRGRRGFFASLGDIFD